MPPTKFEGGLEALDRKDASLRDLVSHAAEVLNVDLEQKSVTSRPKAAHTASSTYSFKEQWVLRWLTRSIGQALRTPKNSKTSTPTNEALFDPAPWGLMQHLLMVIPNDAAVDILVERKFLSSLDRALRMVLERDFVTTEAQTADSTDVGADERSRKRRRLSPDPIQHRSSSEVLFMSLLDLCATCAQLVSPGQHEDDQVRTQLSTTAEECASLLSSSLSLGLRALDQNWPGHDRINVVDNIKLLFRLWSGKPVTTSESAKQADLKLFNKQCLPVCLRLLDTRMDKPTITAASWSALITDLKGLLASSVIVPLRARFLKKHAASWRKQRPCLIWVTIGPIYQDFMASLGADTPEQGINKIAMADLGWKGHAPRLYDLASRLLPKFDLRRKQQEQDWLNCLLVILSYTCCPQLPQILMSSTNEVEVQDVAYASHITNDFDSLENLAELSVTSRCSPSLQSTSYLAAAVATWNDLNVPWAIFGHLIRTHRNLLLSNSGLPTSDFALTELVGRLEQSSTSEQQYDLAKNQVILPMLQSFARARALKDFIALWYGQLQEALRVTNARSDEDSDLPLVMIWADEDLLDSISHEVGISTSTTASEEVLAHLRTAISELASRSGSTLDIFARVAITTALLRAKGRKQSSSEHEIFREVVDSVALALEKRSDYQGQRWRLWSLLNAIQHAVPGLKLPEKLVTADHSSTDAISLAALNEVAKPTRSRQCYQECLKRFEVITYEATKGLEAFKSAHQQAVGHLEKYLSSWDRLPSSGTDSWWDGRGLGIETHEQLAMACTGVLLCRPSSLKRSPAFFEAALAAVFQSATPGLGPVGSWTSSSAMDRILHAALMEMGLKAARDLRKSLSGNLMSSAPSMLFSAKLKPLLEMLLLQDRGSSIIKSFANLVYEHVRDERNADHPAQLAQHLAVMDHISSRHQVSFTTPEAWDTWLKVGEHFGHDELWSQPAYAFVAFRCLRNIIDRIYSAATQSEQLQWEKQLLSSLGNIKPSKSKARLPKQLGLFCQTEVLLTKSELTSSSAAERLQELASAFNELAASDLRALSKSVGDAHSLARIAALLESVSRVQKHYPPQPELGAAVSKVQSALRLLPDVEDVEVRGLRDTVQLQCASFESSNPSAHAGLTAKTLQDLSLSKRVAAEDAHEQLAHAALEADNFVRSLSVADRSSCVRLLADRTVANQVGNLRPFLLAAIVLQSSTKDVEDSPELKVGLANIACLKGIGHAYDLTQLLLEIENANLVVSKHPTVVGQATVDTLLAQLTLVLSANTITALGRSLAPELIHSRVCMLVGSLLSRFRRRIADRYHLLLPVLQQLMRCLFFSEDVVKRARQPAVIGSDPSSFLRSIPDWLISRAQPLPPSSAVEVSRILSSICNPTVSAAKSSRSRGQSNELNDETKRVKAIAGQHLQYLVMDYCRCTLDGDIAPAVKEKLLPGMYTVLDAMSRDLMRAMNSAMDPSSRAIFKTLYDDWTRYGKWDKS